MSPDRLSGPSFTPDEILMMRQAFDTAWAQIGPTVSPQGYEAARTKLADCILAFASDGATSADELTQKALAAMYSPP